jgi:LacI family transcriptional regulator
MTITEIAKLAGVSIGTVDRVIYRRGRVSQSTIQKVEALIEKYNFAPNPIARRLQRGRTYRFCVLSPRGDQDSGYWAQILGGVRSEAADLVPLGVETDIIEFDRYDPPAFQDAVAKIFAKETDGVAFAPLQVAGLRGFIAALEERKIPYIFFDANMPGVSPACAIGPDSFKSGYLAGRLLHIFSGKVTKPVAVMAAHGEDFHLIRRRDGFLQYAQENSFKTLVQEFANDQGVELSDASIARFLRSHPALQGVFITNASAHRIAEAALENKKHRDFFIIGYDLVPDNRRLLREGKLDAVIAQQPETQGKQALEYLFRAVAMNMRIPARVEIPLSIFIRENVPEMNGL